MALPLNKMIRLDLSSVPLPAGAGPLLLNHPIVRVAGGNVQLQERNEIHYDTPSLQLHRHHIVLTLNRRGEQWVQRCGSEDGPEQDKKWVESPVPDQQLDLRIIRKMPTCPALQGNDAKNLAPVFTLHCREQKWSLGFPGGASMFLREERGYIKLGATRQSFHELVFEHHAGSLARWFQTVLTFAHAFFLQEKAGQDKPSLSEKCGPGLLSTTPVTRGFAWLDPTLLMPIVPANVQEGKEGSTVVGAGNSAFPKLHGEMTTHRAFVPFCGGLLQQMQEHQSSLLYGGKQAKLEGARLLYQTAGRLRTLVVLYKPLFPKEVTVELEQETAWLLKEVASVQECQILLKETLEPLLEQFAAHPGLEELLLKAKNGLLLAIKRLEKSLTSFRYARLILGLEQWITSNQWEFLSDPLQREALDMSVVRWATEWLQQYHGKLRKRGRQWFEMDFLARSEFRDGVDRMVHGTELFAELFTSNNKRLKQVGGRASFQACLHKVQSALHLLVHVQNSSRFLSKGVSNKAGRGQHPIQEWQEARIHRYLVEATREWELFSDKPVFWL